MVDEELQRGKNYFFHNYVFWREKNSLRETKRKGSALFSLYGGQNCVLDRINGEENSEETRKKKYLMD